MKRSVNGVFVGMVLTAMAVAIPVPAEEVEADVVVVVDTSTSMRQPGMDPERTSLLVSKLLADLVPGSLAVVRLLDLTADGDLLPSRPTGRSSPCVDDPGRICREVEPATDWEAEARKRQFGVVSRPTPGDRSFKSSLETHLEQRSNNSPFHLSFRAAQGFLEEARERASSASPQTVIWLSDGKAENPSAVGPAVRELADAGVTVEAIVFGQGDEALPKSLGLVSHRVKSPAELMKAFAGAFRRVVQAPYEVDGLLFAVPSFEMKRGVEEAWVVVYGDDTLASAELTGPGGAIAADDAAERWAGAGAYRVAHLIAPAAGTWALAATGGGPGVAYAVIQRSSLGPRFEEPSMARAGVPSLIVGSIVAGSDDALLDDPAVLAEARLSAEIAGTEIELRDDGTGPDPQAGDGRFSATTTFPQEGDQTVVLRLRTPLVDRTVTATVTVSGGFVVKGGPVAADLPFWARWGWLILVILGLLVLVAIVLGYLLPERFQHSLALVFVPSRAEIDEQTPQPVRQWRGVGIGFYRNARAYLHADYRLSGSAAGAIAVLEALRRGTQVHPGKGSSLFRETLDGDWETVGPEGRPARQGDVFRIADRGPFFRVTSRRSGS